MKVNPRTIRWTRFGVRLLACVAMGAIVNAAVAWWLAWSDQWPQGQTVQYVNRQGFFSAGSTSGILVTAFYQQRPGGVRAVINTWQPDDPAARRPAIFRESFAPLQWIDPSNPSMFNRAPWNSLRFVDGFGYPALSLSCAWRDLDDPVDAVLLQMRKPQTAAGAPPALPAVGAASWTTVDSSIGAAWDVDQPAIGGGQFVMPNFAFAFSPAPPAPRALPLRPIWSGFAINTGVYGLACAAVWGFIGLLFIVRGRLRARRGRCAACGYPIGTSPVCTECGRQVAPEKREATAS